MELQTNRYVFNNGCRCCDSAAGTFCGTLGGDVPTLVQELPDDDMPSCWPSQCHCCRCCGENRWNNCCGENRCNNCCGENRCNNCCDENRWNNCCNRCHCSQNL